MPQAGGPAVVGANWYRFTPGERIHNRYVESLCFVWTRGGTGSISCDGETFEATAESVLRLPWGHDVDYRASESTPFYIGTVHVVPWYDAEAEFVARVGFREGDPLLGSPERTAGSAPASLTAIPAPSPTGTRIIDLAEHAATRFLAERTGETALRALGELLLDESVLWDEIASDRQLPVALTRMTGFVLENLAAPLTVPAIAAAGAVSTATAERLFTRHTGISARSWVRRQRMQEAATLLQTTSMRVHEVATRVGYPDAFYFSRVFTAAFGVAPSRYAENVVRP